MHFQGVALTSLMNMVVCVKRMSVLLYVKFYVGVLWSLTSGGSPYVRELFLVSLSAVFQLCLMSRS